MNTERKKRRRLKYVLCCLGGGKRIGRPMAHADFKSPPTFKICLKFLIFLKKFVKIRQALEVPPPEPS